MAIPEDAAITAYVVRSFTIPFVSALPHAQTLTLGIFTGVSKNYVPLYGSPLFGHHLAVWTPNGL